MWPHLHLLLRLGSPACSITAPLFGFNIALVQVRTYCVFKKGRQSTLHIWRPIPIFEFLCIVQHAAKLRSWHRRVHPLRLVYLERASLFQSA